MFLMAGRVPKAVRFRPGISLQRLAEKGAVMKTTNFDRYLKEQLTDPAFAIRFKQAGQAWDVALQIAALRQRAGLSQKELAHRVKTSQQQICRLESPGL